MENINEKGCDTENEENIDNIDPSFTSVFQQLVDKTDSEESSSRKGSSSSDLSLKDRDEALPKRSQTDSTVVQRNLELHLSPEAQQKIQDILNDVRQLSEKEKLLLYLKLPTKTGGLAEESQPIPLSNTRQEQTQAFQWIRSNLEECENSYTLPKHQVYDDYKSYNCESLGANRTLSAPDFGKIIKCVFPGVKARRLGTRGNSKYCYSGLRKKVIKDSPSLPNLNGNEGEVNNNESSNQCNEITEDQTLSAACNLVCEWANKLLGRVFATLLDLARFLVGGSYVSTKSMAAFVVMSATESKVRKMSEKLRFWPSSQFSAETKSNQFEERKSPLRLAVSCEYNSSPSKSKMASSSQASQKTFLKGQPYPLIKTERPQSLPGIQAVTISTDFTKMPNKLMSPPPCPPPKAPYQNPKGSPLAAVSSPILSVPGQTMSKNPNGNSLLQVTDGVFLVQDASQVIPQMIPHQSTMGMTMEQQAHRHTHVSRAPSMLRRSESCPYPSQSPRAQRHLVPSSPSAALSPNTSLEVPRTQSWPSPMRSPHHVIMQDKVNQPMGKRVPDQLGSPMRSGTIKEPMTTPTNRMPLISRCHSVPVPFTTPPRGDMYHPLTPQLGGQITSPLVEHRSPSYVQLKEMRSKFMPSSARRNLTPFLTGNDLNPAINMNNEEIRNLAGRHLSVTGSGISVNGSGISVTGNDISIAGSDISASIDNGRSQVEFSDLDSLSETRKIVDSSKNRNDNTIGNPGGARIYNNTGGERPMNSTSGSGIVNSPQRKQNIDVALTQEAPLVTVDNLIDASFPLGDIPTSGGNGLGDLDGLDDAMTMDLLRSLNSGNNIWATEWTNNGLQLMESS